MQPEMDRTRRLEWAADIVEIQQLAFRYAIAADSKDVRMLAECFDEDAVLHRRPVSRAKLLERYEAYFTQSPQSILSVSNHLIEADPTDANRASGQVYCRCETEWNGRWLIQQIVYHDRYVRKAGRWYFAERRHLLFYGADLGQNPIGLAASDSAELTDGKGSMPQFWKSYREYFARHPDHKHY